MIVVSDTTPIISLLKIGKLDILHQLFDEILIPKAVYLELTGNDFYSAEASVIETCDYIHLADVADTKAVELLRRATGLDAGESEAIIYTDEKRADLLLVDELRGRQVAKQMGLQIMGTIGVLMVAYDEKILSEVEITKCISLLRASGRHISESLYQQLMDKIQHL